MRLIRSLDDTTVPELGLTPFRFNPVGPGRLNSATFDTFKITDFRGLSSPGGRGGLPWRIRVVYRTPEHDHECVTLRGGTTKVGTTGIDGKLVVWNVGVVTAKTEAREHSPPLISVKFTASYLEEIHSQSR